MAYKKQPDKNSKWYHIKRSLPFFILAPYPLWFGLAAHNRQFFAMGLVFVILGLVRANLPKLKEFFAPLANKEQPGEYDYVSRAASEIKKRIDDLKNQ